MEKVFVEYYVTSLELIFQEQEEKILNHALKGKPHAHTDTHAHAHVHQ